MAMLKVYRGPSVETANKQFGTPKSQSGDPAIGGTGAFGQDITPSKVGAPHKRGVKTLGQKMLKPKTTMGKSSGSKGY